MILEVLGSIRKSIFFMSAGFLWIRSDCCTVYSVAKCNEFHNLCVVFCEVTGGLSSSNHFTVNTLILYDISLELLIASK